MSQLPDNLYTAAQTRALDHIASEQYGKTPSQLMAQAGAAAVNYLTQRWPTAKTLLILAGTGNNGGDGFEVAHQSYALGLTVIIMQIGSDDTLSPTALAAKQAMLKSGQSLTPYQPDLPDADIIIDALLGTGINRPVEGILAQVIDAINHHPALTFSMDIPSGLHADTGNIMGSAVSAHTTLSFIGLNIGLFTSHGPQCSGKIIFDDLQLPASLYDAVSPQAKCTQLHDFTCFLQARDKTSHKGRFGHVLVIGGDRGMSGAVQLASQAAARTGAGLCSIATRAQHADLLNLSRPEVMCHAIDTASQLAPRLAAANVAVIGPGLGQSDWAHELLQYSLLHAESLVVDADALNGLAKQPQHQTNWILTPHPGEAARLLNCTTQDIQADRITAIQAIQRRYGGVIVLKGAGTLIYDGGERIHLSPYGNPGMASGGMGDILAGIIGGLLAQGLSYLEAACLGVTVHGLAGDKAAQHDGERGMLALDLLPHVRHLLNPMR